VAADGPLYQQLYQQLCAAIQNGQYPCTAAFPLKSSSAPSTASAATVREATRRMVEEGLISKQPGAGSVVRATQPVVPYVLTSESTFQDAMTYGDSTRLEVLASQRKEADAALAAILHCPQRSVWMELTAMRHPTGQVSPMSYSQIYLRPAFAEIIAHLHGDHPSIYTLLKTLCGVEADSIRQRIEADLMPDPALHLLRLPTRQPGPACGAGLLRHPGPVAGRLVNWYIPARFRMETTWRREDGGAPVAHSITAR
jgi:DNA-binding GntR family transcriptional regulator